MIDKRDVLFIALAIILAELVVIFLRGNRVGSQVKRIAEYLW